VGRGSCGRDAADCGLRLEGAPREGDQEPLQRVDHVLVGDAVGDGNGADAGSKPGCDAAKSVAGQDDIRALNTSLSFDLYVAEV